MVLFCLSGYLHLIFRKVTFKWKFYNPPDLGDAIYKSVYCRALTKIDGIQAMQQEFILVLLSEISIYPTPFSWYGIQEGLLKNSIYIKKNWYTIYAAGVRTQSFLSKFYYALILGDATCMVFYCRMMFYYMMFNSTKIAIQTMQQ